MKIGIFLGRFQPFHKGHLDALKQIRQQVDFVRIIIGSSNIKRTKDNPLSFLERKKYIQSILRFHEYSILPLPDVPRDFIWVKRLQHVAGHFDYLFLTENPWVERIVKTTHLPWKKTKKNIAISATMIRSLIRKKDTAYQKYIIKPLPIKLMQRIEQTA